MTKTTIYALVDCNNLYVSCERAFNPALNGKPTIVLSNNDGCAIALSEETKQNISVWIQTNLFKPEKPQYSKMITCRLPEPTAFTPLLIKYALYLFKKFVRMDMNTKKQESF